MENKWTLVYGSKKYDFSEDIYLPNKMLRESQSDIIHAFLNATDVSVDLRDGSIKVYGIDVKHPKYEMLKDVPKRFVNVKRCRHIINRTTKELVENKSIYFIGWQTTYNGKNYKLIVYCEPYSKVYFETEE